MIMARIAHWGTGATGTGAGGSCTTGGGRVMIGAGGAGGVGGICITGAGRVMTGAGGAGVTITAGTASGSSSMVIKRIADHGL